MSGKGRKRREMLTKGRSGLENSRIKITQSDEKIEERSAGIHTREDA